MRKLLKKMTLELVTAVRRNAAVRIRREWQNYNQQTWGPGMFAIMKANGNCGTAGCVAHHVAAEGHKLKLFPKHRARDVSRVIAKDIIGLKNEQLDVLFDGHMDCYTPKEGEQWRNAQSNSDEELAFERQNAFRVAQILDRLADGWDFDKAFESRSDPVNEDDYNEDGSKKILVPSSGLDVTENSTVAPERGTIEAGDGSESGHRPVPQEAGIGNRDAE